MLIDVPDVLVAPASNWRTCGVASGASFGEKLMLINTMTPVAFLHKQR